MRNFINDYFLSDSNRVGILWLIWLASIGCIMYLVIRYASVSGAQALVIYFTLVAQVILSGYEWARLEQVQIDKR